MIILVEDLPGLSVSQLRLLVEHYPEEHGLCVFEEMARRLELVEQSAIDETAECVKLIKEYIS